MSNSRKIKRSVKRNVSAVSMAALGTVTVGGVLMATAGTAFAAVPTVAKDAVSAAPNVTPGATSQAAGNTVLTISNSFSAGDTIDIPILDQVAAPGFGASPPAPAPPGNYVNGLPAGDAQQGTVAQSVAWTAVPTVTVASATAAPAATDSAPSITAALSTNPNDSAANKTAGTKDMLVLTISNTASGVAADQYSVTLSGVKYDLGAQATAPGTIWQEPVYESNSGPAQGPYPFTSTGVTAIDGTGTPLATATVLPYQVTETPTGVSQLDSAYPISNLVIKEVNPGTVAGAGTVYTVAPASGKLNGTATVTATGFTVAAAPGGVCGTAGTSASLTATAAGTYQFCVMTATTAASGPGSITLSNMAFTPAAGTLGPVAVTVTGGGKTYQTSQPAITVVNLQNVAGYSADDTAAAAADSAAKAAPAGTVHAVVLASDAEYQDALAASYLIHSTVQAQLLNGNTVNSTTNPLVLNPYDSTSESTTAAAQEIRKLQVGTVYVMGGTEAISTDVTNQLAQTQIGTNALGQPVYLQVVRIAGVTAEQTAAQAAQYPGSGAGNIAATPGAIGVYNTGASESASSPFASGTVVKTAVLADADEFQDALASSGLASAFRLPVLLNAGGQGLDPAASQALVNQGIQQVLVVGGSLAVSDQAVKDVQNLGISVIRIAGTTFDATAQELAQFEVNNYPAPTVAGPSKNQEGLNSPANNITGNTITVGTSRGDAYQDALSSAQLLGVNGVVDPLLLNTNTGTISTGTANFLSNYGTSPTGGLTVYSAAGVPTVENVVGDVVFGGTLAQTPPLVATELNDIAAG